MEKTAGKGLRVSARRVILFAVLCISLVWLLFSLNECGSKGTGFFSNGRCGALNFSAAVNPPFTAPHSKAVTFAVIGDYGYAGNGEAQVAELVNSLSPDFVITAGDNNYPSGSASTIDTNIGQYYHAYIYPYKGSYGAGAGINRFFPSPGNHDWPLDAYLDFFELPGNERYYDLRWGPVHLFALDTHECEPDGISADSAQALWLRDGLAASEAPFKFVYGHYPPYSSSATHGSTAQMRWPFREWGADAFLAGHDHVYERLFIDGMPYFVVALGGRSIYPFADPVEGSVMRYNDDYGAMLVTVEANRALFRFYSVSGRIVDEYEIVK